MKKSIWHQKVEVLLERLQPNTPQYDEVKKELKRCEAGREGERRVKYYLSEIAGSLLVLHDIRLQSPNGATHFQMDIVVICPSVIFIFEVKHFSGDVTFNRQTRQLIRGSQIFPDPILQVQRHERFLARILPKPVPISSAIIMSHPNVRVEFFPPDTADREWVLFPTELSSRLEEKLENDKPLLTWKEMHLLKQQLQTENRPFNRDIMTSFQIEPNQLIKGVRCPACKTFTVQKVKRHWQCCSCHAFYKTIHMKALQDHLLLFGPKLTNRELRTFLNIESASVAEKILKKWRVESEGTTRDFVHVLKEPGRDL